MKNILLQILPSLCSYQDSNLSLFHVSSQKKFTTTQNKPKKTKARFSRFLRHLAWKRRGPILILALHKFVRNDLFCVEWDIRPESMNPYVQTISVHPCSWCRMPRLQLTHVTNMCHYTIACNFAICWTILVHGQVTIIFVVSVCLSVCLFVQSFSQPSSIRFGSN